MGIGISGNRSKKRRTSLIWNACLVVVILTAMATLRCEGSCSQWWQDPLPATSPLLFTESVWDFGTIMEEDGPVTHDFHFTNTGDKPVVIEHVSVSCGCTTPEYPRVPLVPGDSYVFGVTFDPDYRPGEFSKEIYIVSGGGRRHVLTITGNVIPKARTLEEDYPFDMGSGIRLDRLTAEIVYVEHGSPKTVKLKYANTSGRVPEIGFEIVPDEGFISVGVAEEAIPGGSGELAVTARIEDRRFYGRFAARIFTVIDGVRNPLAVTVRGIAIDSFDRTYPDNAPEAHFSDVYHHFGTITPSQDVMANFTISNKGKTPLIIRWVESRTGLTCSLQTGEAINPDREKHFSITLDPSTMDSGRYSESVMIVLNDPERPTRTINIEADIFNF